MKRILLALTIIASTFIIYNCSDADIASKNLSRDADMFRINRRIIFYNGITDSYMLTIEGFCSIADEETQLEVTCKLDDKKYVKHFLGLSDNVTYFAEQIDSANVSTSHYKVIFKPSAIVPNVEFK